MNFYYLIKRVKLRNYRFINWKIDVYQQFNY